MKKNTSSNYSGIILLILILVGMPLLEPYLKSNDTSSLIMLFVIIFGLGSFLQLIGNRKSILQIGGGKEYTEGIENNSEPRGGKEYTEGIENNSEPRKGNSGLIFLGAFTAFGIGIIVYGIVSSINRYSS